jgi:hypothetical protein|nr:MAG TPA: hypothetical protein [Bacteriophage sp.]
MLRYEILGNITLKIDLHNGYAVIAVAKWNKNTEKYFVSFYLQDTKHQINHFDLIEDCENLEFDSNNTKSLKTDVTSFVNTLLSENVLVDYIKRYEYEQKCFELGNELLENERIGK